MSAPNPTKLLKTREKIEAFTDWVKDMKEGFLLTWDLIEEHCHYAKKRSEIYPIVLRAKQRLLALHGVMLENKHNEGYLVMPKGTQINSCISEKNKGVKKIFVAATRSTLIRANEIEDAKERENTFVGAQRLANLTGMMMAAGENSEPRRRTLEKK